MIRKLLSCAKCIMGRRRSACLLPVLAWIALLLLAVCWLQQAEHALLPPAPPDQSLHHFRRSRELQHYLDHIDILIEPSSVCPSDLPLLVLVSSTPGHMEARAAIRETWGSHVPTYFVLGLVGDKLDENLADTYVEAKQHGDLLVLDMTDHYQNLTLKTMLMLHWTHTRCPQEIWEIQNDGCPSVTITEQKMLILNMRECCEVEWLFKTDDDVLVNPWTLKKMLAEHTDAALLGYRKEGSKLHRDEYTKWFVPHWLHSDDVISEYLSGTGYLVRGKHIDKILSAAKNVPLMNLEDVYLTYLVSKATLNLDLTHDRRLSPYRPWIPIDCAYFSLASMHSLKPHEIADLWPKIERMIKKFEDESEICSSYKYFDSDWFLY